MSNKIRPALFGDNRANCLVELEKKQSTVFKNGWKDNYRFRVWCAGRRSGKSILSAVEILRAVGNAIANNVPITNKIVYACPQFNQAKRNLWPVLMNGVKFLFGNLADVKQQECRIVFKSGHEIMLAGLDDPDKLRGLGIYFIVCDEFQDVKQEAWEQVIMPTLATGRGNALIIGTPKGYNFFYELYCRGKSDDPRFCDWKSWQSTTLEGGNVPPEEIETAKNSLDPRSFRQEYEATFENFTGRIYYDFNRVESVKSNLVYDKGLAIHVGMDFNVNPMSAVILQERPDGEIWAVDEVIIPTSNTHEMCEELIKRYGNPDNIYVYPDPAGAQNRTSAQGKTDISILQEKGFRVIAMRSHPLVRDRINEVNSKIKDANGIRRLYINSKCVKLIESLEKMAYKEDSNEPDKSSGLDHVTDALGYYIYTRFKYVPTQTTRINYFKR